MDPLSCGRGPLRGLFLGVRGVPTPDDIWQDADLPTRRLAGLALNPAAPLEVLLHLLAEAPSPYGWCCAGTGSCRRRSSTP